MLHQMHRSSFWCSFGHTRDRAMGIRTKKTQNKKKPVIGLQPGSLETIKIPHPHKPCHRIQWNLYELQAIATLP